MKRIFIRSILFAGLFLTAVLTSAQHPPYPNNGSNPGNSNVPVGGGAPVGGGLIIFAVLAAGYGTKKIFDARKKLMN